MKTEKGKHLLTSLLFGFAGLVILLSLLDRVPSLIDILTIVGIILLFYMSAFSISQLE